GGRIHHMAWVHTSFQSPQRTKGRVKVKAVRPFSLVTEMSSPWLFKMVFTIYSPSPTPSRSAERDLSALWKRSKSRGSSSGDTVGPVFCTVTRALPPSVLRRMESMPPGLQNLMALSVRL